MNAAISAEWVYTFSTIIPIGLVFWWLVMHYKRMWVRSVWERSGVDIRRVSNALDGCISPKGLGWRITLTDGRGLIIWTAGVTASSTIVKVRRSADKKLRIVKTLGLAPSSWVLDQFESSADES